VDKLSDKS